MGVPLERPINDKTHKVQDVFTREEWQVTRDQLKLPDLPEEIEARGLPVSAAALWGKRRVFGSIGSGPASWCGTGTGEPGPS